MRRLRLLADPAGQQDLSGRIEASKQTGIRALRDATDAYFNAMQLHRKNAKEYKLDIFARRAGEDWRLAAQTQQNYERVRQQVGQLTRGN